MRQLIGATLLGAAGAASAADLSAPALPTTKGPLAVPTAYNWSGFYVGVNAGGNWYGGNGFFGGGNVRSLFPASTLITIPTTVHGPGTGFTAGGLAGYNYQIDSFVLGAETDFDSIKSRSDNSGSTAIICCETVTPGPIPLPLFGVRALSHASRSQLNWFGTARMRFGFVPTERLMIYGTGGLAYGFVQGDLDQSSVFSEDFTSRYWQGGDSSVKVGWTLGAGAEYALTSAISIRAEYLYLDLGKSTVTANYAGLFLLTRRARKSITRRATTTNSRSHGPPSPTNSKQRLEFKSPSRPARRDRSGDSRRRWAPARKALIARRRTSAVRREPGSPTLPSDARVRRIRGRLVQQAKKAYVLRHRVSAGRLGLAARHASD